MIRQLHYIVISKQPPISAFEAESCDVREDDEYAKNIKHSRQFWNRARDVLHIHLKKFFQNVRCGVKQHRVNERIYQYLVLKEKRDGIIQAVKQYADGNIRQRPKQKVAIHTVFRKLAVSSITVKNGNSQLVAVLFGVSILKFKEPLQKFP